MSSDGHSPLDAAAPAICVAVAVDHSGIGIWDRDIAAGRIFYSSAWKAMLGYGDADISDNIEEAYTRVHPGDFDKVSATMQAHFDQRTPRYEVEHRLRCKDGSYKWVLTRGKVVCRDADGKPLRMAGVTTDISATIALSEKLRQNADLLAHLTDEVPGLVYQYRQGRNGHASFPYVSAGIADIFGVEAAQAAASAAAVEAVIHPDDIDAWRTTLALSSATLQRWHLEFRVVLHDASVQWRRGDARPRRMPDGATVWHGFIADITEDKRLERLLLAGAETDFLTGLPNRRHFIARLERELARLEREPQALTAVLMFDLDHFKNVNDRYGHATGDKVLQHFGRALQHELRKVDSVGRIGGEEFAVALPGADLQDAAAFAERLRGHLAANPMQDGETHIATTVSIGVAAMRAEDVCVGDALSRADAALYRAKQYGRNRVELA